MDGIEKITGRIAADGAQEAQAILAEARRQIGSTLHKLREAVRTLEAASIRSP